jgi:hypothetical protein
MVTLLRDIRDRTPDEHPLFGSRAVRQLEAALATAALQPSLSRDEDQFRLHGLLAEELLRVGRTEEAIEHMHLALERSPASATSAGPLQSYAHYRLAVASLRLGENANCVHCTNGASCLLPIRPEGVHTDPAGSLQAIQHLLAVLEADPADARAVWLLNIAHMTVGTYPDGVPEPFRIPERVFAPEAADVRPFSNVAHQLGLDHRSMAGGAVVDDFDGDDYLDILTSSWDTSEPLRWYRNNRDGTFSVLIAEAGLEGIYGGLNLIQADYDNDGDVDVFVLRGAWLDAQGRHPNSLLQNNGSGRFRDVTFDAGLGEVHYPTQTAAWADYDNDGDLDLFVGNERYPAQLFENNGRGQFTDVAERAGVQNGELAKGCAWGDFNQDRWPDLYVSNYPGDNRLYRNNRDGTFTDVARELGVVKPYHSFPLWFWDFDNDGLLDLYVSSYEPGVQFVAADYLARPVTCEPDRLYRGLPDGRFEDVAAAVGLTRVTQPMGCNFGDINNDGWLDFYLGTGYVDYEGLMPNLLFVNRGGRTFEDVTFAAGVGQLQKGHGVALADLDNDGDLDIFEKMGGALPGDAFQNLLFENPGADGNWLSVRLVGKRSNRSAIGARIHVVLGQGDEQRHIYRWVNSGGSFGANPLRQHIGLGSADRVETLEIYWPTTDLLQTFRNLAPGQWIEITEGEPEPRVVSLHRLTFAGSRSGAP